MRKLISFTKAIEKGKPLLWGLLLASVVANYAVGNILLILLGLIYFIQLIAGKSFQFRKAYWPILIYFMFGCLSLLWTTNISSTMSGITKGLYLLIIPLLISQYDRFDLKDLRNMIRVVAVVILGFFLLSFVRSVSLFLNDGNFNHFFYHDLAYHSSNSAIYLSYIISISILILFNLKIKKTIDNLLCLGLFTFLILLSSKTLIIVTLLIQILIFLRLLRNRKSMKKIFYFIGGLFLIFLLLILIDNPVKDRFLALSTAGLGDVWHMKDFSEVEFNGLTIRVFQWRVVYEMFLAGNIGLLGMGWNNVDYISSQYFSYYNFYRGYFNINFHNQYLQTLGELGIIGLGLLLNLLLINFRRARIKNLFLIVFTLVSVVSFFSESYLNRQKGIIIFVVFYCVLVSLNRDNKAGNEASDS